jgi:hypothetical protein
MPSHAIEADRSGQGLLLRVSGDYDDAAALALRALLDREPDGGVVVDFCRVRSFLDSRLAMLVVMVSQRLRAFPRHGLRLLGLRDHQERLLAHFGVEVGEHGKVELRAAGV